MSAPRHHHNINVHDHTPLHPGAYAGFVQGGGGGVKIGKSRRKFRNDSASR